MSRMPSKRKAPSPPKRSAPPASTYAEWKASAAAELQRRGVSAVVMREKEWHTLYISGKTPEEAAEHAQRFQHNATVRTRRR